MGSQGVGHLATYSYEWMNKKLTSSESHWILSPTPQVSPHSNSAVFTKTILHRDFQGTMKIFHFFHYIAKVEIITVAFRGMTNTVLSCRWRNWILEKLITCPGSHSLWIEEPKSQIADFLFFQLIDKYFCGDFFFFFAAAHSRWDLSSLTRDPTSTPFHWKS